MGEIALQRVLLGARVATAVALFAQTVVAAIDPPRLHGGQLVVWAELVGCGLLLLPRIWPAGAALLLLVFTAAAAIHAIHGGNFLWLIYPTLLLILFLTFERTRRPRTS